FTSEPAKLTHYCPNTKPLTLNGRRFWRSRLVPRVRYGLRIDQRLSSWEDQLRTQFPGKVRSYLKFRVGLKGGRSEEAKNFEEYMEAIFGADVVVASGGGYITDIFKSFAATVLDTLDLANRLGKPTAMFSQGLGPLRDSTLLAKAKTVFSSVRLIALRE